MPTRFEELPLGTRHDAERAACRFLVEHRYVSLDEACQDRGLTLAELWSRVLREADLPDCDPPCFAPFV